MGYVCRMSFVLGLVIAAVSLTACDNKSDSADAQDTACAPGKEGCACDPKSKCDDGLVCASDTCVDVGTVDGETSGDTNSAAGDTSYDSGDLDDTLESTDSDEFDTQHICERIEVEAGAIPNRVLIVQDLSSSLDSGGRWDHLKAAMQQLVLQYENELAMGAIPFPTTLLDGTTSDADCTVDRRHVIEPALGNGVAINDLIYAIESRDLIGGTPTHDALMLARDILVDDDPHDGSGRYIILVTDGLPNCLDGNGGGGPEQGDIDHVTDTIETIHGDDITIYVVGYDMGAGDLANLNQWASLGGTEAAYPADDTQTLLDQMSAISGGLITCSYTLARSVVDPRYVRVRVDGETISFDDPNGWSLSDDKTTVTLEGESCALLQTGEGHTVDVAVECKIVVI